MVPAKTANVVWRALLTFMAAALAAVVGVGAASAHALTVAEARVGVSIRTVGAGELTAAGQRLGPDPAAAFAVVGRGGELVADGGSRHTGSDSVADELGGGSVEEAFHAIVTDLVGGPSRLLAPDGSTVWSRSALLWGEPGRAGDLMPLRFPGQFADAETGLLYNVFRYYDAVNARYISSDPLGQEPGPNTYAYVTNPTTLTDPLGLSPCGDAANSERAFTRFTVNGAGEATMHLRAGDASLEVTEHAAQRLTQRGISIDAAEATLQQQPFQYFHADVWKTGYYDPASRIFLGSVDGRVTTVIGNATPRYIANLQAVVP
jgi:RHS repeat-associated protein